jgi:hypothetical protein
MGLFVCGFIVLIESLTPIHTRPIVYYYVMSEIQVNDCHSNRISNRNDAEQKRGFRVKIPLFRYTIMAFLAKWKMWHQWKECHVKSH